MRNIFKTLAAASVALMIAGTASAATQFSATIRYDPTVSVAQTYQSIDQQVTRLCSREIRRAGRVTLSTRSRFMNSCRAELMEDAVNSINAPQLTAFYQSQTGAPQVAREYASN